MHGLLSAEDAKSLSIVTIEGDTLGGERDIENASGSQTVGNGAIGKLKWKEHN